jgi:fatty-acyl-CoA synthase
MAPTPTQPLPGTLEHWAASRPERTVLVDGERRLSWAQLNDRADHLASALAARGLAAGDIVAVRTHIRLEWAVVAAALGKLGCALLGLNWKLTTSEARHVMNNSRANALVCDDTDPAALLPAFDGQALKLALSLDVAAPGFTTLADLLAATPAGARHFAAGDPPLIIYTSGTTGLPKAAVHTPANLLANMAIAAQVQGMTAADSVLTVLPLFHVGGLCIQTLPALAAGAHVRLFARFDAAATLRCIANDRPTLTLQVPATLQALTQHADWAGTDLSSLRAVWAGSSLLPPEPLQALMARGVPVCNVYGSTETGPFSIALPPAHAAGHLGACGWPAPGVDVRLLDPQGTPVVPGQVGEIAVRGPNVVARYWPDRPALDADGFFRSGDLAQQAPDGSFTVVGRAKDMIISGGENIYPAEIEHLIAQHPAVAECSVVGQADARWGEVAVAAVVLRDPAAGDDWAAPLQAWLDGRLARYKWPRRWVRLDALPRTALGKVKKAELVAAITASPPG